MFAVQYFFEGTNIFVNRQLVATIPGCMQPAGTDHGGVYRSAAAARKVPVQSFYGKEVYFLIIVLHLRLNCIFYTAKTV
jgi:hypothetical protein